MRAGSPKQVLRGRAVRAGFVSAIDRSRPGPQNRGSSTHGWAAVTGAMQRTLSFEAGTVGSCCGDRDGCEVRLIVRRSTYQSRR
ncbi:hypothetical protein CH296_02865 [Rhodococcus sp. 14-2496-1d]|nr:hypothetical protein CH296_02865 [Rhodococcus sp. 14-2496-1d]